MKLAILHLSDAHFLDTKQFNENKISRIAKALNEIDDYEELFICFTGDITFSGKEKEYRLAKTFMFNLYRSLRDLNPTLGYIHFFIVPGNHDYSYNGSNRSRNYLKNIPGSIGFEKFVADERNRMGAFFEFAADNNCFENSQFIDKKNVKIDDKNIHINLINSAFFSDVKSDDKGLHFIPDHYIEDLNFCNADLTITLMHHTLDWFTEDCKRKLSKALCDGTSILLLGHEHNPDGKYMKKNVEKKMLIFDGGMLSNTDDVYNSNFNVLSIDLATHETRGLHFNWNVEKKVYISSKIMDEKYQQKKTDRICLNEEFYVQLLNDECNNISSSFLDYYVFPNLEKCEPDEFITEASISCCEEFIDLLEEKNILLIEGSDKIGKSCLAKKIFLKFYESKTPILLTTDNVNGKSIDKIIQRAFEDQYSDKDADYALYCQIKKEHKIAIIDDVHLIKSESANKLVEYLKGNFGYVILISKIEWEFDIIKKMKEKVESSTKNNSSIARLRIDPFYSDKRKKLIHNVCQVLSKASQTDTNGNEKQINEFINSQLRLFESTPDFLIKYINYIFSAHSSTNNNSHSIFSKVFEANITNAIRESKAKASTDEVLIVLDEIAHYIHFKKRYPLKHDEFVRIIENYNLEYKMTVNSISILESITKAKIVKIIDSNSCEGNIVFSNNNYLAFFVARRLNRKLNEDGLYTDIEYVLKNICFGINGDVLLFISSQTDNLNILKLVYSEVDKLTSEWSEFSTEKDECFFLENMLLPDMISIPTDEDKRNIEQQQINHEKKQRESDIVEVKNLYNYDEDEVNEGLNIIIKAISLTKMIARILPNFYHMLPGKQKDDFAKAIYVNPNKIVNKILLPIYENYEEIVKDELSVLDAQNNSKLKKDDIEFYIQNISLMIILSIYETIAKPSITEKTKDILIDNSEIIVNEANCIQKLMMLENGGYISEFITEAERIYDNAKFPFVRFMIKQIVKKLILTHDNISKSNYDRLCSKYFNPKRKKLFLLETSKNRS